MPCGWLRRSKENTAVLASKRGDMRLHKSIKTLPKKGIILEPLCGKVFGPKIMPYSKNKTVLWSGGLQLGPYRGIR